MNNRYIHIHINICICMCIFINSYLKDNAPLYSLYNILYNFVKRGYTMTVLTYSNARKDFRKLIDKVNDDSDTVTITTNDRNAVLISED
ncbi:type II toxin-antitoxin system Phd/YefM family antitoxin, partial [Streptomyces anthocyanicus]|uniref:type II toxin-antitoxin system Phd/YefM family antitoxin n=1 Tax=Streptomyces anthocyanicus TaxID=68174 RepID=UPI0036EEC953